MAIDEGILEILREDVAGVEHIKEVRMFGGICLMHRGNMLCGVHKDGAIYRVGKPRHSDALALEHVKPMTMTGRSMGGFVDVRSEAMDDDILRKQLLEMALEFTTSLPAK